MGTHGTHKLCTHTCRLHNYCNQISQRFQIFIHLGCNVDIVTPDERHRWLCRGEGSKPATVTGVAPSSTPVLLPPAIPAQCRSMEVHALSPQRRLHPNASKAVRTPLSLQPPLGSLRPLRGEGEQKDSALCSQNNIDKPFLVNSKVTKGERNTEKQQSERRTGVGINLLGVYRCSVMLKSHMEAPAVHVWRNQVRISQ